LIVILAEKRRFDYDFWRYIFPDKHYTGKDPGKGLKKPGFLFQMYYCYDCHSAHLILLTNSLNKIFFPLGFLF